VAARGAAAARRYGKALFGLARDEGRIEDVRRELGALLDVTREHAGVRDVLAQPLHPAKERHRVLAALSEPLRLSPLLRNFGSFLIDQRRMVDLPAIAAEYGRLADEAAGRTRAEVVAASPLTEAQAERLRSALSTRVGREVELSLRVDPELIAGAVARVGDLVFDGSLKTQLAQIRASLAKEH
jgi:F-type H+-transporting ATPase subunit delta